MTKELGGQQCLGDHYTHHRERERERERERGGGGERGVTMSSRGRGHFLSYLRSDGSAVHVMLVAALVVVVMILQW